VPVVASEQHLFILSGQSNMAGLKPQESFIPAVETAFGKEQVIVVHSAQGGQPIRRWYKQWKDAAGNMPEKNGDLYDVMMKKIQPAIAGKTLTSVTFLWMQGERDAKEQHGDVYKASFIGLIEQLKTDLPVKTINVVIGRLSDFDVQQKSYPHWNKMREVLVELATELPQAAWVDTDDLNDGVNRSGQAINNDLHYSAEGYVIFGQRLADKAIALIKKSAAP
jgi:hypothetical protein